MCEGSIRGFRSVVMLIVRLYFNLNELFCLFRCFEAAPIFRN